MKLGFHTAGNTQTNLRTAQSVLLGKMRNTPASITRKFKFCNATSPDLDSALNCVFNGPFVPVTTTFEPYHILNEQEYSLDWLENQEKETEIILQEKDNTVTFNEKRIPRLYMNKSILKGPFTPSQIKQAYSVPTVLPLPRVRRPIITIITAFRNPFLVRDVATFGRIFRLPRCNLIVRNFSRRFVPNWAVETTMNVQWVYAMNPYAQIRVIQAASNSWGDMMRAIRYANNRNNFRPRIQTDLITMSFGIPDNGGLSSFNGFFNNPNTIYFAASGNNNQVSFPSSASNVIAVGGTSLNLTDDYTRATEKVWSRTGCGFAKSFPRPIYQPSLSDNNARITPDVCCVADRNTGCYVILNGRAYSIGGTSVASPIYAGMFSLITQKRLNERKPNYTSVSNQWNSIQPLLYNSSNKDAFFDITEGSSGGYIPTTGFDIASGLGSLNCQTLYYKI